MDSIGLNEQIYINTDIHIYIYACVSSKPQYVDIGAWTYDLKLNCSLQLNSGKLGIGTPDCQG